MKVLAVADAGARTGFERVAREVLSHLHTSGLCEVVALGINYNAEKSEIVYPYPVYPAGVEEGNNGAAFGIDRLDAAIEEHQPDVVWILQDLWNIQVYVTLKRSKVPVVAYYPVDAPNMKWHYAVGLGAVAGAATYTKFAAMESAAAMRALVDLLIRENPGSELLTSRRRTLRIPATGGTMLEMRMDRLLRYQNLEAYTVIPHGLDTTAFEVRSKQEARQRFGIPESAFVVMNVGTNQYRKRLDVTLRAFALLAEWAPEAVLVIHCARYWTDGWDLRQLADYLGISDRCFFVHELAHELPEDDLVWLYNAADVHMNTSGGEGWGLTSVESAACGVPQMVPDWSATREIWRNSGALIPVNDWRMETKFTNTAHANCDARSAGAILVDLWLSEERRQALSEAGTKLVQSQWPWSRVAQATYDILYTALREPQAEPVSFADIIAARTGDVRSELKDALWWERGEPVTRAAIAASKEARREAEEAAPTSELDS